MGTSQIILRRSIAMAIDMALLFAILTPLGVGALWLSGLEPQTGWQVHAMLLVNFSLPAWMYFTVSDAGNSGQTLGKRLTGIHVSPIGWARALVRTALKLAAWELIHLGFFGLATRPGEPGVAGWLVVVAAYALLAGSVCVLLLTRGRRSLHDLVAGSSVEGAAAVA